MNYSQAEKYLNSFTNYEVIPGTSYAPPSYSLTHVEELLNRMGDPQLAARLAAPALTPTPSHRR